MPVIDGGGLLTAAVIVAVIAGIDGFNVPDLVQDDGEGNCRLRVAGADYLFLRCGGFNALGLRHCGEFRTVLIINMQCWE